MPESRPAPPPRPWVCLLLVSVAALACDPPPTSIPPGPSQIISAPVVERPIPPPTPVTTVELGDAGPPAELPAEPGAEPTAGGEGTLTRDGGACERAVECQSGICEGQGCGADRKGVCMSRNRACTRDIRTFCGCDGKTFQGSSSCPGQRFSSRGQCK